MLCQIFALYTLVVVLRAVSSWFPIGPGSALAPVVGFLHRITEPVFAPIRGVLPSLGGFDFTPVVVLIGLQVVAGLVGC
ncbi:MAG: YggT family protein [Acidimicrobiales bacterium]